MIKFVYFDVGGTVIKDFSKRPDLWDGLKKDLGITDQYWQENCDKKLDIGIIPNNLPVPYGEFLERFVSRFKKNPSIWPILQLVKEKYRTGLLTNMYSQMLNSIKTHNLMPKIEWDIIVDSTEEGIAKPNKEIYEIAAKKAGVKPEEILFIDNTLKNIETAKNLNWDTFLYDSGNYELSSKQLRTCTFSN